MPKKTKKISADEAREKRKDLVRDTDRGAAVCKAAKAPASWDKELRSARFIMSTAAVDRYGDIVVTDGLDTTEFERNPVGLLFHNSRTWPVANWANIEKVLKGRPPRMEGDFILLPAGGPIPEIEQTEWMLANGGIRACSIGFIPDWNEIEMILDDDERWTGGLRFPKSELVECSVVPVPAAPGALIKDAPNMMLARELIEDILDNWAKSPAGLLMPRAEYEAAHKQAIGQRTTVFVERALVPTVKMAEDAKIKVTGTSMKADASTQDEADAFVGATVYADPAHPENKDWPFDVLKGVEGEVIASWIVEEGEKKGVHALAVEFLCDAFSGMFRGIAAERFVIAPAQTLAGDQPEKQAAAPVDGAEKPDAPAAVTESVADKGGGSMVLTVDTTEAEKDIGRVSGLLEGLSDKIARIFSRHAPQERVEPAFEPPAPPSVEAVVAAKSRAASVRERVAAKAA